MSRITDTISQGLNTITSRKLCPDDNRVVGVINALIVYPGGPPTSTPLGVMTSRRLGPAPTFGDYEPKLEKRAERLDAGLRVAVTDPSGDGRARLRLEASGSTCRVVAAGRLGVGALSAVR